VKPDADLIAVLCGKEPDQKSLKLLRVGHLLQTRHTAAAADDALAAWHAVRREVLPQWIAKHPGTRPLAWWRYEAPAPMRRIVQGRGRPPGGDPLICGWPENLLERTDHVAIESQAAYLKRHGLLSAEEESALLPEAFTPTVWPDPIRISIEEAAQCRRTPK
jgi:hypothetical protein